MECIMINGRAEVRFQFIEKEGKSGSGCGDQAIPIIIPDYEPEIDYEEALETFRCATCLKFSMKEVYCCTNNHLICSGCSEIHRTCPAPECGTSLEGEENKLRCRTIEDFLDDASIPCKNKAATGCQVRLSRKELKVHEETCGVDHRGRDDEPQIIEEVTEETAEPELAICVCKKLGFDCDAKVNVVEPLLALLHLEYDHGVWIEERSSFNKVFMLGLNSPDEEEQVNKQTPSIIKISQADGPDLFFAVVIVYRQDALLCCTAFFGGDNDEAKKYVTFFDVDNQTFPNEPFEWSCEAKCIDTVSIPIEATNGERVEENGSGTGFVKIPVSTLKQHCLKREDIGNNDWNEDDDDDEENERPGMVEIKVSLRKSNTT